jgi:hypothetical protein
MSRTKDANGRVKPGHDVERAQVRDYRSKARPTRKVWNDSFRLMLTLLDGDDVQVEAGLDGELVQRVARPKVLV